MNESKYEFPPTYYYVALWVRVNGLGKCVYYRRYLDARLLIKYMWYFKYLAAKLQVSYPRSHVELKHGNVEYITPDLEYKYKLKTLVDKRTKCRADITKMKKAIEYSTKNWNELQIETSGKYQRSIEKLDFLECKHKSLQNDIDNFAPIEPQKDEYMHSENFYGIKLRSWGNGGKVNLTTFKL